jgi:hypothetical protein
VMLSCTNLKIMETSSGGRSVIDVFRRGTVGVLDLGSSHREFITAIATCLHVNSF